VDHQQRYAARGHIGDHAPQPLDRCIVITDHDARLCSRDRDPWRFHSRREGRREPGLQDEVSKSIGKQFVRRRDQNDAETLDSGVLIRSDVWLDKFQ
jgi:hypothetical protein